MAFIPLGQEELRIGLFVKLECSWWNHPFAKSTFKISSTKEIRTIRGIKNVKVFYDPELSDPDVTPITEAAEDISEHPSQPYSSPETVLPVASVEEVKQQRIQACREHAEQLEKTGLVYQHALGQTKIAMKRITEGHAAGLKSADQVVRNIQDVLKRSESTMAMTDVLNSSSPAEGYIAHALNVCVLCMLVGRGLGLNEEDLLALGLGALLHDIGKEQLSSVIRTKKHRALTKQERQEWARHPLRGKEAVARYSAFPEAAAEIIEQHHERVNGTGFPRGLTGSAISRLAQIVMVVDEYDNLSNQVDVDQSLTPAEALSRLYRDGQVQRTGDIPEDIVLTLVSVLGVYPPGTVVELADGQLGLVTSVNAQDSTKPRVMLCTPEIPLDEAMIIDLSQEARTITHSIHPRTLPKPAQDYLFAARVGN